MHTHQPEGQDIGVSSASGFSAVLLIAVGLFTCWFVPLPVTAQQDGKIFVEVDVQVGQDRSAEAQLESFIRRELRALPDVEIPVSGTWGDFPGCWSPLKAPLEYCDYFHMSVLAIPITQGARNTKTGLATTIGVSRSCPEAFSRSGYLTRLTTGFGPEVREDSSALALHVNGWVELQEYEDNCGKDLFRTVHVWPVQEDKLRLVRALIAEIDTDLFEPVRN